MALAIAVVGALVGRVRTARASRRRSSPPRCGSCSRRCAGGAPLGGFPWADVGVALHDFPAGAGARRASGGTLLVTFVVVAVNGLPARPRPRAARAHDAASAVLAGVGVVAHPGRRPWSPTSPASSPRTTGHLRVALLQGDDEQLPLAAADRTSRSPTKHFALADQLRGHYDLIVFPESALDTDPRDRSRRCGPRLADARRRARRERARERAHAAGDDEQSRNSNLLYDARRQAAGHLLEAAPRAVRRVRAVARRARASSASCARSRTTSSAGDARTLFRVGGHPFGSVICFESAFGPLVRDYVRDGARGRRREHEQPLVPAVGQQRAAPRARPDARGRDRARRCCRRRCRGSAR